jgi:rhodanese-related sulfurtransferase
VFEMTVARTGLSERLAKQLGYHVVTALMPALDRAHFMPNAALIMIKLIADAKTRKLLGMQAIGYGEVAKRMDVAVTALTGGLTVDDVANLDLSYAPSYSNALDNIHTACNIIRNKLDGYMAGISPVEARRILDAGEELAFLDVRTHAEFEDQRLEGCIHIPLPVLRARLSELPRDKDIAVYSQSSLSAYEAFIILRAEGFTKVKVLDGGLLMWPYETVAV